MPMARFKVQRPTSWFVLLAFLIATLAPSLGMALGGHKASRTVWTQLCSATGPELVAIQVDDDPPLTDDSGAHQGQGHCLLCLQPSTTPQPSVLAPVASNAVVLRLAQAETAAMPGSMAWNIPLARAPPAVS